MSTPVRYTIDVTMLGPSGAGKTSLLASMYVTYSSVIGSTDLELTPVGDTAAKLSDAVAVLRSLSRSVLVREHVQATRVNDVHRYRIAVGCKGKKPRFTLQFTDYAGELLRNLEGNAVGQRVAQALAHSPVIVLAVDSPALMEEGGRHHERINQPYLMLEQVKQVVRDGTQPRLLVIVPLKCEKYVATEQGANDLVHTLKGGYKPLLDHIAHESLSSRVGCVIVPVQTTGSIVFSSMRELADGHLEIRYRSRSLNAPYLPVDTDQPLRYALRFLLNTYRRDRRGFWREMADGLFGADDALGRALEQFTQDTPRKPGIEVVRYHPYMGASTAEDHGR